MGEKLVIGPFNKGLRNDREPFVIDNDSFPTLINAYQWRGRVKRKRGTSFLTRLQRFLGTTDGAGNLTVTISPQPILNGISSFTVGTDIFVDPGGASPVTLLTNSTGAATLNRTTGVLTITGSQATTSVIYFPGLPVMGLETLLLIATQFPGNLGFDTTYSYNIPNTIPHTAYDVSFYKNPAADGTNLPGYVPKGTWTPLNWNGKDYQQFWSTNHQGALWVTNGIDVPFTGSTIGMQFRPVITTAGNGVHTLTATTALLDIALHGLVVGDFVYVNEVVGIPSINYQTGYVTIDNNINQVTVTFPNATLAFPITSSSGIVQYLTNTAVPGKDCIRWYDGDMTGGTTPPTFTNGPGWVNFSPPLSQGNFSISDLPAAIYYLVGARMIVPFKDRLLFLGPVVQSSTTGPFYLQDTVIYSQNGTAFYTSSFTGNVLSPSTGSIQSGYEPILVPSNQIATAPSYFEDQTGFGGFITAAIDQPLITVSANEDSLIMGFSTVQTRFLYTGNDLVPFNFFLINSELGSGSTFSVVNMDQGVISRGSRGYIITSQTQAQRIDLEIPDQVFEVNLLSNGNERFCAQRDFIAEWIYFTYPSNQLSLTGYKFPNQTLEYNYRDNSWGVFNESFTTYGSFTEQSGLTWNNVGQKFPTWESWNTPWNSGALTPSQPNVIGGNQQGFVLIRNIGTTAESTSLTIQSFSGNTVTSPNHTLNEGDYIIITGCATNASHTEVASAVNGKIFSVLTIVDQNNFTLNPPVSVSNYLGGGLITRLYVPQIQTKQFPTGWELSRKTRLGPQQYLLSTTENSQIQLLIFLSQDGENPYNSGSIVPSSNSINNSLVYSTVLYTCPESTNLGLTTANVNLQMPTAITQKQIWHRLNTSLLGDTVQLGFTLSDDQMRALIATGPTGNITNATQANPCVLNVVNDFAVGQLVTISGVTGMTQLNGNTYLIVARSSTQITIQVDSTTFNSYISGGVATQVSYLNTTAEIELHGIILDVSPSQVLA